MRLERKTALARGGASGIGAATAPRLGAAAARAASELDVQPLGIGGGLSMR